MRLPQLSKANRRARMRSPESEFVLMAQKIAMDERNRREAADLRRLHAS